MTRLTAIALSLITVVGCSGPPLATIDDLCSAPHPGATWRERLARATQSPAAWRARSEAIRQQILVASGLWPEPARPPVSAELSRPIERDGYTVQGVQIETLPGFNLNGTLYRPRGKTGRVPAVVSPHGHWADGRFTDHGDCSVPGRAIQLARMGIAVLTYDMVGFGDLKPLGHAFGDSAWGSSLQGLQLWNSLCAVDFLCSLPDVDPERIGATGESGGGTQTFLLAAVDPRIQVSIPVNMVAAAFQGGCLCENAPLLRIDLNNVEIAASIAPRPLLMLACTGDWTWNNPKLEAPVIQGVYAALGAADHFRCVQIDADHNYNQQTREPAYAWLARWLLGAPPVDRIAEMPFTAEPRASMELPPVGSLESVADTLRGRAQTQLESLRPRDSASLECYRDLYRTAWRYTLAARLPAADEVVVTHEAERLVVKYAALPDSVTLVPLSGGPGPKIWVAASTEEARRAPSGPGWLLCFTPHTLEPACNDGLEFRDAEWREPLTRFPATYHRTELARRVQDVLTALTVVHDAELSGERDGAAIVVLARALAPGVTSIDLQGVDEAKLAAEQPNFLGLGGLRGAALLSAGHPLTLCHPSFACNALDEAWRAAGAAADFHVTP